MALFDEAVRFVLDIEQVVSNDPEDSGKLTKWGISEISYPEVRDPVFSRTRATQIYRQDFWDRCHCDLFPPGFALMLFDSKVNQTQQAVRLAQSALQVPMDGIIGPVTIEAANRIGSPAIQEFAARRMVAYAQHPGFRHFGLGWSRRLMQCFELALELENGETIGS